MLSWLVSITPRGLTTWFWYHLINVVIPYTKGITCKVCNLMSTCPGTLYMQMGPSVCVTYAAVGLYIRLIFTHIVKSSMWCMWLMFFLTQEWCRDSLGQFCVWFMWLVSLSKGYPCYTWEVLMLKQGENALFAMNVPPPPPSCLRGNCVSTRLVWAVLSW